MTEIVFENHQWVLTDDGILESRNVMTPEYWVENQGLARLDMAGEYYEWPRHMASKNWIDMSAFEQAFREALKYNRVSYDPTILDKSFKWAHDKVNSKCDKRDSRLAMPKGWGT